MKHSIRLFCVLLAILLFACSSEAFADGGRSPVEISEIMASNRSTVQAQDGSFPDWIELYNPSEESVSLSGFTLSDRQSGKGGEAFPDIVIPAQGRIVIFADEGESTETELHVPFKLSKDESIFLFSADGILLDELSAEGTEKDRSVCKSNGEIHVSSYPTPGFENSADGFAAFQASLLCNFPLQINEVKVSEYNNYYKETDPHSDWVELINVSADPINLSDYYLSDDFDDLMQYRLPEMTLPAGAVTVIMCAKEDSPGNAYTGFALNAEQESLFLTGTHGVVDFVSLHDIPYAGSYGRLPGENGFFYFAEATRNQLNTGRSGRSVSVAPAAETADGLFEGQKPEALVLRGEGTIYYTTDTSYPTESSNVYTGPIPITENTVVRAVAVQGTNLPSIPITRTYLINENHTLPVVSIVGNAPGTLFDIVNNGQKYVEVPGNLAMYENGKRVFSVDCGLKISGQSSRIVFPKRNIKVEIRGAYGQSTLGYDLFGTGFSDYDSFILRGGQDSAFRLFSNEIWQDLCLEMSDSVLTQHGKFCIVYVNGQYYGIYVMKENISKQYYADWLGVDPDTVESEVPHNNNSPDYLAMYNFIKEEDMSVPENYARACSMLDVDSFIDWSIMEGLCGNFDLFLNVRFFRSSQNGNRYQMALFDLDNSMSNNCATWNCLLWKDGFCGMPNTNATNLIKGLFKSPEFREAFLRRYGEVYDTVLSNERVLERIEHYEQQIRPEIARDRRRWDYSVEKWEKDVQSLKDTIVNKDWQNFCVDELSTYIHITDAEREAYFN